MILMIIVCEILYGLISGFSWVLLCLPFHTLSRYQLNRQGLLLVCRLFSNYAEGCSFDRARSATHHKMRRKFECQITFAVEKSKYSALEKRSQWLLIANKLLRNRLCSWLSFLLSLVLRPRISCYLCWLVIYCEQDLLRIPWSISNRVLECLPKDLDITLIFWCFVRP